MIKFIIKLPLLFVTILGANEYDDIANNFLTFKNIEKNIISSELLQKENQDIAYLFNLSNGGYILVPISKKLSPIKAYSFQSNFNTIPPKYKEFILNQIYAISSQNVLAKSLDFTISKRWEFLENYTPPNNKILYSYIPNTNLITTVWNQDYPYNKFLPKIDDKLVLTGCVQTAYGQIINYHNYPLKSVGVKYSDVSINKVENLKAVLNRNLNWENMPNDLIDIKEYQEDEIGYFMRDLFIANEAVVESLTLTNTYTNTDVLVENYGYSNTIAIMQSNGESYQGEYVDNNTMIEKIKSQIDSSLPVLFSLPGHMVIADGYNDDESGKYIHLNMGWAGSDNNYYQLDEVIIAGGTSFGTEYQIVYNIKPCSEVNNDCSIENSIIQNVTPVIEQILEDKVITTSKKVLINGYDENIDDNITFTAQGNSNVSLSFDKNILTITPVVAKGHSRVIVKVESNGDTVEKEFNVLINDENISFGKEFKVNGIFENESEFDKHKVILDGICSVSGFNGYSSQAFYTSLLDINENYLNNMDDASYTTNNLNVNYYLLGASLQEFPGKQKGEYYTYDVYSSNYTLSVSCPTFDINTTKLATILNIDINNEIIDNSILVNTEPVNYYFDKGWTLNGAVLDVNTSNILCTDSDLNSIWKYDLNNWKLYTPLAIDVSIEKFTLIHKGEGFWVNCN